MDASRLRTDFPVVPTVILVITVERFNVLGLLTLRLVRKESSQGNLHTEIPFS